LSQPIQASRSNTEAELERLLLERLDHPERIQNIDAILRDQFFETYAVLVLDSSGFSLSAQREGIIAALTQVSRMRRLLVPLFQRYGGKVFKLEVDNIYAVFPTVEQALQISQDVLDCLLSENIHVSIGIGYGDLIMISEGGHYSNVYGKEMNLASKLGEDLAKADEIFLTDEAFRQLARAHLPQADLWTMVEVPISKLVIKAHQYCYRPNGNKQTFYKLDSSELKPNELNPNEQVEAD